MGKVIAVVSGKGGTGKTSLTANVGTALARMGKRVLCLDCDVALRNLDLALGLSDRSAMDFSDVTSGSVALSDAVTAHPQFPGLDFLSAPITTEHLTITRSQMRRLCDEIRGQYDFCLADASAGLGLGFQLSTACADKVLVVTTTEPSALRDAQRTVMELASFGPGRVHLVVNRVQRKMLRTLHTTIDDAIDAAGLPLLGVVPEDSDVSTYTSRGIPLCEHNYYAYRAYENIAKRLSGVREPLLKI